MFPGVMLCIALAATTHDGSSALVSQHSPGVSRPAGVPGPQTATTTPALRILLIADGQGTLVADDGTVPLAKVGHALDSVANACDCPVLVLSAGDHLRGTPVADLLYGRPMVEVLRRMGVAASTVGPGELSLPLDSMAALAAASDFAWVAANVVDRRAGARPAWLRSSTVLRAGALRVGVIGVITPQRAQAARPETLATLQVQPVTDVLATVSDFLRERAGADLVVLLVQGVQRCSVSGCQEELSELAANAPGTVDLLLAGGAALPMDTVIGSTPLMQPAGVSGWAVADWYPDAVSGAWRTSLHTVGDGTPEDSAVAALARAAQARAVAVLDRAVARIRLPLPAPADAPNGLSQLVAQAFRNAERAQVGMVPLAMMEAGLEAGTRSYGDVRRVFPGGHHVVSLTVTGEELIALLEAALMSGAPTVDVAGATVRYDPRGDDGDRVRSVRLLDGNTVGRRDRVRVALPVSMLTGPGAPVLQGGRTPSSGWLDTETFVHYLQRLPQPIDPPRETRFEATR